MSEEKVLFSLQEGIVAPRWIASADLHIGHRLYKIPDLEDDLRDNFIRLCDLAISKKVDYLVIAGDLFEDNLPLPKTIALIKEQVTRLKEHNIAIVGIAGDHDKPINGESWCSVSGILPVSVVPHFAGVDYYNYSSGMQHLVTRLKEGVSKPQDIQFIFLHCQIPQLFQFAEDKKKVDFSQVEIFKEFPNLQAIIAGDIHNPVSGTISEKDREAFIGYCGSLGISDISEAAYEHSVIHCDGHKLIQLPFPQRRDYVRVNFKGDSYTKVRPDLLLLQYKDAAYRPVFSIDYDSDSEPHLSKLKCLYDVGFVRTSQTIRNSNTGKEESVVNVRSELKTDDKIDATLKECCEKDEEVYGLLSEILTAADPKSIMDKFKAKALS